MQHQLLEELSIILEISENERYIFISYDHPEVFGVIMIEDLHVKNKHWDNNDEYLYLNSEVYRYLSDTINSSIDENNTLIDVFNSIKNKLGNIVSV